MNGDGLVAPADRLDFLNAPGPGRGEFGGLNDVDLWIGGLPRSEDGVRRPCWARLSTMCSRTQLENLQNGDRFYYLSRTQGMNLLNQLEPNTFTDLVMRNTESRRPALDASSGELFMSVSDMILELDQLAAQENYSGIASLDGTGSADPQPA